RRSSGGPIPSGGGGPRSADSTRGAGAKNEDVREDRAEQAVEHDGLGEREAEPLDALELTAELRLAGDRLDHRAEDVPDADAGAERAKADAEGETDRLAGFGDIARRCCEKRVQNSLLSAPARSPSRCRWRIGRRR